MNIPTNKTVDLQIVGGGIFGASIAYYYKRDNPEKEVIVFEKKELCSGNTSFAAGLISRIRSYESVIPLSLETYCLIHELEELTGDHIPVHYSGAIHMAVSDATRSKIKKNKRLEDSYLFNIRNKMKNIFISILLVISVVSNAQSYKTKNLILITLDGFRWQELFNGADSSLLRSKNLKEVKSLFWSDSFTERRNKLLPFFWSEIGLKGQLYGNRNKQNFDNVTNRYWFSYPGYNELFTGFGDDSVNSNDKINNRNVTVFEAAGKSDAFKNKVAAFASWDCFPYILNTERSGIYVNAGNQPEKISKKNPEITLLNDLIDETAPFEDGVRYDIYTFHYAFEYMKANHPKLMFIGFDETDDYAHEGKYDRYLLTAHQSDKAIGKLWTWLQSQDQYRDQTTLIITCDHGRGSSENEMWRSHGEKVAGSDQTWLAIIGPDTEAFGEMSITGQIYSNQVAMTIARLLNLDYKNSLAGKPILSAITK